VRIPAETVARVRHVPGDPRLLVLGDDWCGDAVNTMPVIAGVAAAAGVALRVVGREQIPGLMERHLTHGTRSIPKAILLGRAGEPLGSWGPRPTELQAWFERQGRGLPKEERTLELRRWYARDRGASTAREIADLLLAPGGNGGAG
jgi:hypothetical protein